MPQKVFSKQTTIQVVRDLINAADSLSIEFVVKKKPQGMKIIYEVTQEEMDSFFSSKEQQ